MPGEKPLPPLDWRSGEISWPLALAGGFAGTWLGVSLGVPGLGALAAAAAAAPIVGHPLGRGRVGMAAGLLCGWFAAAVLAHVGCAWELGEAAVERAVPGGAAIADAAASMGAVAADASLDLVGTAVAAVLALGLVLVARPASGFLALVVAAAGSGVLGSAAAVTALRAKAASWDPVSAGLVALPPTLWFTACGALVLACGIAAPGPLRPLDAVTGRRRLLGLGLGLVLLGLALGLVATPAWAAALADRGILDRADG